MARSYHGSHEHRCCEPDPDHHRRGPGKMVEVARRRDRSRVARAVGRGERSAGRRLHVPHGVPPPEAGLADDVGPAPRRRLGRDRRRQRRPATGATLDFSGGGMVMQNPNRPAGRRSPGGRPDRPHADLSGEVPQRVIQVLDSEINPAIAPTAATPSWSRSRGRSPTCACPAGARAAAWPRSRSARASRSRSSTLSPRSPRWSTSPTTPPATNPYYEAAKK